MSSIFSPHFWSLLWLAELFIQALLSPWGNSLSQREDESIWRTARKRRQHENKTIRLGYQTFAKTSLVQGLVQWGCDWVCAWCPALLYLQLRVMGLQLSCEKLGVEKRWRRSKRRHKIIPHRDTCSPSLRSILFDKLLFNYFFDERYRSCLA